MHHTKLFVAVLVACCVLSVYGSYLKDWTRVQPADASERITFFVALKQRNLDQLEDLLYSISDPRSPSYGRQATQQEVADLVYPPKEEHDRVHSFLTQNRPSMEITSYGDSLKVTASVSDIASIFDASFHWYHHAPTGHKVIRAPGITIPNEIKNDVYMVTNLVALPIIMKERKVGNPAQANLKDTNFGYFAPDTLRRLYNIPEGTQTTNKNSSQCAMEFAPEGAFLFSDLELFCKLSDEKFYNYTHVIGPFTNGAWGDTESELDVQLLATIGSGAENWFWTITDGWIYEMAVQVYNNATKPLVFSISYGWPEVLTCGGQVVQSNCEGIDNEQYITRANAELAKLGTARISVIVCSQDEGAPSSANMGCGNTTHPIFGIYPGSSPFATSVSGTSAVPDKSGKHSIHAETYPPICYSYGCSNSSLEYSCMPNNTEFEWTTGGGFSEFIAAPSYQTAAIAAYFANNKIQKPPTRYTWPKNRGYPDISAIGARVIIVVNGETTIAEGTSASTPIIAGITTLLNDVRLNAGKTPLGFLNLVLYTMATSAPKAFNDITIGSNSCTEGSTCCDYGYHAGKGWDPVTGLGSPNYSEMLAYVKTLP